VCLLGVGLLIVDSTAPLHWLVVAGSAAAIWNDVRPPRRRRRRLRPESRYAVVLSAEGLISRHPQRPDEVVRWDQVTQISVVTTRRISAPPHLFLLLHERSGIGATVPVGAPGSEVLLARLSDLPGFDLAAVVAARHHDGDDVFPCWQGEGLPLGAGGAGLELVE